ncbi:hypothetical protein WICPIJ_004368 [Wickerhamomyces pijperi]|uniref:Uncharacterized protein n=1 Tax=Wickerhamomyces pijperi TaxID=599730 RepID=A0A9P8Q623_WICPI|nr:hypothetical protein WICPIJ_004368 [Wickerhamomyces pijperi]
MEGLYFNIDKNGLLTSNQYINLTQCENLEDLKLQLSSTDYGNFLSDVATQLSTSIIQEKASKKLQDEFRYIREQAVEPLRTFLDYITCGYMIDNASLVISGAIHHRNLEDILERTNPLGWFETLPALKSAEDIKGVLDILKESPLAKFITQSNLDDAEILDDLNIEIVRNRLYKAYLEDFYLFTKNELSDPDSTILPELLQFEADRRVINITTNSLDSGLSSEEKLNLFPRFGNLYDFSKDLSECDNAERIREIVEYVGEYKVFFDGSTGKSIEDHFYEREMNLCRDAFTQQFTFSTIWAWLRSKEQEVRNITWIAEYLEHSLAILTCTSSDKVSNNSTRSPLGNQWDQRTNGALETRVKDHLLPTRRQRGEMERQWDVLDEEVHEVVQLELGTVQRSGRIVITNCRSWFRIDQFRRVTIQPQHEQIAKLITTDSSVMV